jgi:hypothetical protein
MHTAFPRALLKAWFQGTTSLVSVRDKYSALLHVLKWIRAESGHTVAEHFSHVNSLSNSLTGKHF